MSLRRGEEAETERPVSALLTAGVFLFCLGLGLRHPLVAPRVSLDPGSVGEALRHARDGLVGWSLRVWALPTAAAWATAFVQARGLAAGPLRASTSPGWHRALMALLALAVALGAGVLALSAPSAGRVSGWAVWGTHLGGAAIVLGLGDLAMRVMVWRHESEPSADARRRRARDDEGDPQMKAAQRAKMRGSP